MLGLHFKVGLITYISFVIVDQDLHLGLLESPRLYLCLVCVTTKVYHLVLILAQLSDFYPCTRYRHVIYAQWSRHPSHTLLCHLRLCLPTRIRLPLSISRRLDPSGPSRTSTAYPHRGSHTTPSCLSQATSVVDVTCGVTTKVL